MRINKLTLKDFGVYAGLNTFQFESDKPVVLIGGMNGNGKTTFLEAVLLSLYGSASPAFLESGYKAYSSYLREKGHRNSKSDNAFIELEFTVEEENDVKTYIIKREWNPKALRPKEQISVWVNGVLNSFLSENWAMFIENLIPAALADFYFFDGEKIASLAVEESNSLLKDSFRSILGLKVIDQLETDLGKLFKRETRLGSDSRLERHVKNLKEELLQLSTELESLDQSYDLLLKQKEKDEAEILALQNQEVVHGANVNDSSLQRQERKSSIEASLSENSRHLTEIAGGAAPLALTEGLLGRAMETIKKENESREHKVLVSKLDEAFELYQPSENGKEEVSSFIRFIKSQKQDSEEEVFSLESQGMYKINALLENDIPKAKADIETSLQRKSSLKTELDAVMAESTVQVDQDKLEAVQDQIEKLRKQVQDCCFSLGNLDNKKSSLSKTIYHRTAEYKKSVGDYLSKAEAASEAERKKRYLTMQQTVLQEYGRRLQGKKVGKLSETITDCFSKLANKKTLINQVHIDGDTLNMTYLNADGQEVRKDSLSAGEKQLLVISILWGLAICSDNALPVIIDTPLSRLDSAHRRAIIQTYFPNASDQTIILSTDSEINEEYYQLLKPSIGDEFILKFDEQTQSTKIYEGYFSETEKSV